MPQKSQLLLSDRQKQICYGTVLGDSAITLNGANARLQMHHGMGQKDYITWKFEELSTICTEKSLKTIKPDKAAYSDKLKLRLQTRNSPDLTKIYNMLRPGRKKKYVTREFLELLEPLAITVWFCDDGALTGGRRHIELCTHDMTFTEVNDIRLYFEEKWGIKSKMGDRLSAVTEGKQDNFLRFYTTNAENLLKLVVPQMPHTSMLYKTFLNFNSDQALQRWNSYLESQYVPKFFQSKNEFREFMAIERAKKR